MTLEQLRIFTAVAERQHVTRAAEALNLADPRQLDPVHAALHCNRIGAPA